MPDPSKIADFIDVLVSVAEARSAGASFSVMLIACEFAVPAQWTLDGFNRQRTYLGDLDSVDEALEAEGFVEDSEVRRMARAAFRQTPTPDRITVGRRDAADATWPVALSAIRAAGSDWYAFTVATRLATDILAIAEWAETRFVRYTAQNADAAVLTATPGNVLVTLQTLKRRRTVYLWHAPEVASNLGPAVIRTAAKGPWDVSDVLGSYLNVEIGGTETPIVLSGAPASELGTVTGPFNLEGVHQVSTLTVTPSVGDTVGFHFDALAALTVTSVDLTTDNAALAALWLTIPAYVALGTLVVDVGTLVFTAADFTAHTFTDDSVGGTADVAHVLTTTSVDTSAWHLDLEVPDGAAPVVVLFAASMFVDAAVATAAEIGVAVVAAIGASKLQAGDAATLGLGVAGRFAMRSPKEGTGQAFEIVNTSTAALLTALGISAGVNTGGGDMADSAAMSPAEVAAWIQAEPLPAATASAVTVGKYLDYVEIETDSLGEFTTARVRGAAVNDVFGFARDLTRGRGTDEDYADVQWAAGRLGGAKLDLPRPQGLITWNNFAPFNDGRMGADVLTEGQRLNVRAQGGNTLELRTAGRLPGEFHFGKAPSGHFVDTLIAADWVMLRLTESIQRGLNEVADAGGQIDFSDAAARVFLLTQIGEVFDRAVSSGIIAEADMTPPNPEVGKITGLTIPRLDELPEGGPTADRFWSGITFVQQGGRALHGAVIRGSILP